MSQSERTPPLYRVSFSIREPLIPGAEASEYVRPIVGEIECVDAQGSLLSPAGQLVGQLVRVGSALLEGESLREICGASNASLLSVGLAVFDFATSTWSERVEQQFDAIFNTDLLVIERVEVLPEHRGRSVGLAAARRFIETFSAGCGLAVCQPAPLQFSAHKKNDERWQAEMRSEDFSQDEAKATRRLIRHCRRLGFRNLRGTDIYALQIENTLPSLREMGVSL